MDNIAVTTIVKDPKSYTIESAHNLSGLKGRGSHDMARFSLSELHVYTVLYFISIVFVRRMALFEFQTKISRIFVSFQDRTSITIVGIPSDLCSTVLRHTNLSRLICSTSEKILDREFDGSW